MPAFAEIALELIDPPDDPQRKETLMLGLGELMNDIQMNGLMQPVGIRLQPSGRYYIIWGHRRYLAHKEMGRWGILAMVYAAGEGDDDLLRGSENLQHNALTGAEEAEFYAAQMRKFNISASEVARRYQRSPSHVSQLISLLDGDAGVLLALREGRLNKQQCLEINRFTDIAGKSQAIKYALDNGMSATAIREWRESRERNGVADALRQIEPIVQQNGVLMMQTNLYCQFHKDYLPMKEVQTLQICDECFGGLAEALEFWTAHGHNQDPPEDAA
jgi:ParB/RepB/Spo0J family partition protein